MHQQTKSKPKNKRINITAKPEHASLIDRVRGCIPATTWVYNAAVEKAKALMEERGDRPNV